MFPTWGSRNPIRLFAVSVGCPPANDSLYRVTAPQSCPGHAWREAIGLLTGYDLQVFSAAFSMPCASIVIGMEFAGQRAATGVKEEGAGGYRRWRDGPGGGVAAVYHLADYAVLREPGCVFFTELRVTFKHRTALPRLLPCAANQACALHPSCFSRSHQALQNRGIAAFALFRQLRPYTQLCTKLPRH